MILSRRKFLFGVPLVAVGAGTIVDELLKPRPTIFLPPRGGWVSPYRFNVEDLMLHTTFDHKMLRMPSGFPVAIARGVGRVEGNGSMRIEDFNKLLNKQSPIGGITTEPFVIRGLENFKFVVERAEWSTSLSRLRNAIWPMEWVTVKLRGVF